MGYLNKRWDLLFGVPPVAGQQRLEICDVLSGDVFSLPMIGYINEKSAICVTEYLKMLLNSY